MKGALATFFFYCAIEAAAGLWGASYLVEARGLSAEAAARGVSLYFLGITLGRFLSGFASMRMKSAALIRLGQLVSAGGAVLLMLPLPAGFGVAAMAVLGLGFAPVYPSMIHETPYRFGAERSQAVIGLRICGHHIYARSVRRAGRTVGHRSAAGVPAGGRGRNAAVCGTRSHAVRAVKGERHICGL